MKAKRMLSLLLTAALMLSMMTPAFAAAAQTELPLASQTQMEETNEAVSIRLQATGKLVYGSPFELSVVPARQTYSISAWCWASKAKPKATSPSCSPISSAPCSR